MTHIKLVDQDELDIYMLAEKHDLAPKLISYTNLKTYTKKDTYNKEYTTTQYEMITEKYSHTLLKAMIEFPYIAYSLLERLSLLINNLHEIDIYHNDVHAQNIVYDIKTDRLKFIDFGLSYRISNPGVTQSIINRYTLLYGNHVKEPLKYIVNLDKRNSIYIKYKRYHEWANKKDQSLDGRCNFSLKTYIYKKSVDF
jgi:serine/threonine protein kinase